MPNPLCVYSATLIYVSVPILPLLEVLGNIALVEFKVNPAAIIVQFEIAVFVHF